MKESILDRWKAKKKKGVSSKIPKAPKNTKIPLSRGQRRLWFLQQLHIENPFYNYPDAYVLKGELKLDYLIESIQHVFSTNDILRTTCHNRDEAIVQEVHNGELPISVVDLSAKEQQEREQHKEAMMKAFITQHFDLSEFPLIKALILKISESEHMLILTMHHIIVDKWSMEIFRNQMARYYVSLLNDTSMEIETKETEIQYTDYAFWQSQQTIAPEQLIYWKEKLAGQLPVLNLPTDYQRKENATFEGGFNVHVHGQNLSKKILELSKKLETTPYVFLLSAYYLLLYRYSGQTDILIGSPISNRTEKSLENVIGFFNETVVLRTKFSSEMSFSDLVANVRETALNAFSNKDIPFETLVKELNPERSLGLNPFFRTMFLYHTILPRPSFGKKLELDHHLALDFLGVSKFDITLYVAEDSGSLSTTFEYATDLFQESTIIRLQKQYELVLEYVTEHVDQILSKIPMLTQEEKTLFFPKRNDSITPFQKYTGIHQIIDEIGIENKEVIAVVNEDNEITYGELLEKANKCASEILAITKGKNRIVGLCTERSIEMIIGILGILKAGCAYLPIDPEYPSERISFMLKDAKVSTVLTQKSIGSILKDFTINELFFEDISQKEINVIQLPKVEKNDLAYVIYTSGSTGKPKGVPISHQNIIRSTESRLPFYEANPEAFLLLSSIAFDSSKAGIFWTLCTGGKLVIGEKHIEQNMSKLGTAFRENGITHTLMLPSLYNLCLEHCDISSLETLKTVLVAGEVCSNSLLDNHFRILPNVDLYNEYGPTEGTVWCIAHKVTEKDKNTSVPIGKAVAHSDIYLLDKNLMLAPHGSIGEIFIGGPGLAGEYLNHPELTEGSYIKNPFDGATDGKLYRTGDLGRYNSDGNIEFLGRADQQVKIRGHRIEIDEIENVILQLATVQKAIVTVQDINGAKQLIAFIVAPKTTTIEEVKKMLKDKLPKHMVPSKIMKLDTFPQLPNGKVDRNALLELGKSNILTPSKSIDIATTETQQKLIKIWEEVLQISPIGINDNFFELGGDSILSIQIIAKARKMDIVLTPSQLFEHQTVAELAIFALVSEENENEAPVVGEMPLTPIQHWFFDTHQIAPNFWNQAMKLTGFLSLNKESVQAVTKTIVARHDALRNTFIYGDDKWKANILAPDAVCSFSTISVEDKSQDKDLVIVRALEKLQVDLNLTEGPLFRCVYVSTDIDSEDYIILLSHHLVVDVVSWQIIIDDFKTLLTEKENRLGPKTSSIKDWTNKLHQHLNSDILKNEIDFWKEQILTKQVLPLDFEVKFPLSEKNIETIDFELDASMTDALMGSSNDAYGTKVDELILTALTDIISRWTKGEAVSIAMERHGRETDGTSLNLSNTVGWFTAFFPITFRNLDTDDIATKIISVKEQMRSIPNGGIGYGILRYLANKLGNADYPQIVFNFLGKQTNKDSTIEFVAKGVRHPLSERNYLLEINASIIEGRLNMRWSYGVTAHETSTIEKLIADFKMILTEIINHCTKKEVGKYTPSDFPEVGMSQEELDNLLDSLE